ncbi:hypothetical protein [Salininema proteolyticum]|uniref:Uncharacterized protein n=1 Tax=Salininema proteolyticum TaxID=1607685 RepID=A0ABV8U289_9ACTN
MPQPQARQPGDRWREALTALGREPRHDAPVAELVAEVAAVTDVTTAFLLLDKDSAFDWSRRYLEATPGATLNAAAARLVSARHVLLHLVEGEGPVDDATEALAEAIEFLMEAENELTGGPEGESGGTGADGEGSRGRAGEPDE